MEEAFVSLVTAFFLDNNEMSSHPNSSNPLAQASEVHQAPVVEEEGDGDHDCYDFIPSFKDFMVPQRDRAFSWDVSFENGLHSDNGSILPTNMHDLFPTHHQASAVPSTSEDATRLTIKAKFPAKASGKRTASDSNASLPVIKTEGKRKDSFGGIDHLDHEDILDDDDDAADDFLEDPLLLSIPPDLLIEGSGLSLQQSSSHKKSRSRTAGGSSKEDKPNKRSKTTPSHAKSLQNETIAPNTASSSMTHSQDLYLSVISKSENGLSGAGAGKAMDSHYSSAIASTGPGGYPANGHSVLSAGTASASSNSYLSSMSSGSHGYNQSSLNGSAAVAIKPAGGGSLNYANPLNTLAYSNYNHPNQPYSAYSSSASAGNSLNHSHHGHHSTSHHHHHHHHSMHEKRVGIYTIEERRMKIEKFREKKRQRIWRKQIKYDCRKRLADTRPRVKGRFVSRKNQGADGGNPFGSPCGSKDATTNDQSDEEDSVGGANNNAHAHALHMPTTTPMVMMSARQPSVSGANMTTMKYPQSQPLTGTVGGLHSQTSLSSQYGGYHHTLPSSSLNEKGEYSIGGGVLPHPSSTASTTATGSSSGSNHHHYNYPVHSSLPSSSSSSSLHTNHHYVPPSYNTIGNTASLLNQQANNVSSTVSRFAAPLSTATTSVSGATVPMSIGGTTIPQSHSQQSSTLTTTGTSSTVSGYAIHQANTSTNTSQQSTTTTTTNLPSSSSMYPPATTNPSSSNTLSIARTEQHQQYRSYPTTTISSIPSSTSTTCEATKTTDRIL